MPDNVDRTYVYTIKQGTLAFVCKTTGVENRKGFPILFELHEHYMKKDMTFPRIKGADILTVDPGAVGVHDLMSFIPESKRGMMKQMVCEGQGPHAGTHGTFWELLEGGFNIFATGHKKYPYLIIHKDHVQEEHVKYLLTEKMWESVYNSPVGPPT